MDQESRPYLMALGKLKVVLAQFCMLAPTEQAGVNRLEHDFYFKIKLK